MSPSADAFVLPFLGQISPSGALEGIAKGNPALDQLLADFDAEELVIQHLSDRSLVDKLEDDAALIAPDLIAGATYVEGLVIPVLSALAGPGAPFLSFGLVIACKVAHSFFTSWAARRRASIPQTGA